MQAHLKVMFGILRGVCDLKLTCFIIKLTWSRGVCSIPICGPEMYAYITVFMQFGLGIVDIVLLWANGYNKLE